MTLLYLIPEPRGGILVDTANNETSRDSRKKRKKEKKKDSESWTGKNDVAPLPPEKKKRHDKNLQRRRKKKAQKKNVSVSDMSVDPYAFIFE